MDLEQVVKGRRSIRRFLDKEVPLESVMKAISLACWAPNGGNFQSWKFFVVTNRGVIDRMADTLQEKMDLMAEWPEVGEFGETFQRYRRNACFFRQAPVVIGVAYGDYQSAADRVLRRRGETDQAAREMLNNRAAAASRVQTIAGAIQTMLLGLQNEGLGACWMVGPMLVRGQLEEILGVPKEMGLYALVPVGYPETVPDPAPRKPMSEVVTVLD